MTTKKSTSRSTSRKRMSDVNYRQLADFRFALRLFLEFSSTAAREAGLTPQQHQALLAIKGLSISGPVSVGDVASRLLSRHHSAVELVDRLADAKLIERQIDPDDKRRVHIVLTAKAERALERLSTSHLEELKRLRPLLQAVLAQQA